MSEPSWARVIVRGRRVLVPGVLLACLALAPLGRRAEEVLDVSGHVEGSEAAAVEEILATRFESPFARSAVVVLAGVPSPRDPRGREALGQVVKLLAAAPGVTRTYSYLDGGDGLFLPAHGEGTFVVVGLDGRPFEESVPALRRAGAALGAELRGAFPSATVRVTGEPALNLDLRRASATAVAEGEARALPLTALLLLLAFGTLAAALLPVLAGGLAVSATLGLAVLLSRVFPLSVTLQSVASMLGLGLGIDYALLTVSRFREARARGRDAAEAATEAAGQAGHTVLVSGAAVAIGFGGLLVVPVGELRSLGVGGLVTVAVSMLLAVVVLPGVLAGLGARVDLGRVPLPPWPRRPAAEPGARWRSWGARVAARPLLVLALGSAPILLLAGQARRLDTRLPSGDWLPPALESAAALRDLRAMGRAAVVQEIRVVLELPEEVTALTREGWEGQAGLGRALAADPRVARLRTLRDVAGERGDDLAYVSLLPGFVKRCFLSSEGEAALLGVVPREGATPAEAAQLARDLRRLDAAALTGLPGARLRVGGLPAFNADYEDAVAGRFGLVVALVVLGTLAALIVAFRSLLVPVKAVALNLLSVSAAFGALVLVFQDGHGGAAFGLLAGTGSVFPAVPVLVFAIVFGLSMDYEVFLVARVAEARAEGLDDRAAVAEGLAHTGGVITSAAAVMVAVFGAFASGDLLLVQMLGFALAVAVLVDATVIRLAVGPALLCLAGRWNWWPGGAAPRPVSPALARALQEAHPVTEPGGQIG